MSFINTVFISETADVLSLQVTVIQGARILRPDQFAKNGVVHEVDKVIERTTTNATRYLSTRTDLTTFAQILARVATSLTGPFTMFAPTNAAFVKMRSEFWSLVSNNNRCLRVRIRRSFYRVLRYVFH